MKNMNMKPKKKKKYNQNNNSKKITENMERKIEFSECQI